MGHSIIDTELSISVHRKECLPRVIKCQLYMDFKFKFERQKSFFKKLYGLMGEGDFLNKTQFVETYKKD